MNHLHVVQNLARVPRLGEEGETASSFANDFDSGLTRDRGGRVQRRRRGGLVALEDIAAQEQQSRRLHPDNNRSALCCTLREFQNYPDVLWVWLRSVLFVEGVATRQHF